MSANRRTPRELIPRLEQCEIRVVPAPISPGSFFPGARAALFAALAARQNTLFHHAAFSLRGFNMPRASLLNRHFLASRLNASAGFAMAPTAITGGSFIQNSSNRLMAGRGILLGQPQPTISLPAMAPAVPTSVPTNPAAPSSVPTTDTTSGSISMPPANSNRVDQSPAPTGSPQPASVPTNSDVGDEKNGPLANAGQNLIQVDLDYQQFLQHGAVGSFANSPYNSQANVLEFQGNSVGVDVKGTGDPIAFQTALRDAGMQIQQFNADLEIAEGFLPVTSLVSVAGLTQTVGISPVARPMLSSPGITGPSGGPSTAAGIVLG